MSLSSTSTLKGQLTRNLGPQAQEYFDSLSSFVSGKTSRQEFEDTAKSVLVTPTLRKTCPYEIYSQVTNYSTTSQCSHNIIV